MAMIIIIKIYYKRFFFAVRRLNIMRKVGTDLDSNRLIYEFIGSVGFNSIFFVHVSMSLSLEVDKENHSG